MATPNRFLGFIFFILLIFISIPSGFATRAIPEEYIKYPVMVSIENGATASGFYYNDEQRDIYFITARHVLYKKSDKADDYMLSGSKALLVSYPKDGSFDNPIFMELALDQLEEQGAILKHDEQDVVVVKIGIINQGDNHKSIELLEGVKRKARDDKPASGGIFGATNEVIKKYDEILIGNEVFVFGYPTSLGLKDYPQIDYQTPLLRKGVIAGKNDAKKTIILDCPIHFGNSGGPVIEVEKVGLTQTRYTVIGVVSEFVPFDHKRFYKRRPLFGRNYENSGYSIVVPMETILDLIRERDILN